MACTHPERPNVLSLPSAGNPHCCRECFDASGFTPFKGKREAWEREYDYVIRGDSAQYSDFRGVHYDNSAQDERTWK